MNEFSYVDIFATKGFEYLLVIGFFLLLVGFWRFLSVPKEEIRKAQAEREELRRLLDSQRDRMDAELSALREQRESLQNTLLERMQMVEHKALAAWHETHAETSDPPDLVTLLDWVLAERGVLAEDKRRLDHLTHLAQSEIALYREKGPDESFVVDASANGRGTGTTLRSAIDAIGSGQTV